MPLANVIVTISPAIDALEIPLVKSDVESREPLALYTNLNLSTLEPPPPPPPPDEAIVTVSVPLSVVSVMPEPAASVSVSEVLSAEIVFCPLTAILANRFCEPPPPLL